MVIGVPTLRLSGHYFSMATIAVAELVRLVVTNAEWLGGAQGLSGPAVPRTVLDLSFISALPYYYLFLAVLAGVLALTWWMENSRIGYYLRAISDSERAARSLGVAAPRYKLYAFVVSAALTSVAGALYAVMFGFVDPDSGLGILVSVKMLIMAALGGAGLLLGPAHRRGDPGAARGDIQQPARRGRARRHVRCLRRDHHGAGALPARRHSCAGAAPRSCDLGAPQAQRQAVRRRC